jgi:four helix bundle protein
VGCGLWAVGCALWADRESKGVDTLVDSRLDSVVPDYHKLDVWRLAHGITLQVYRMTTTFPMDERFGLVAQIRRSAASVAANLAEGAGRGSDRDFARFVAMARASANETEYHALLARDLGYLTESDWNELETRIGQARSKLSRLRETLQESAARSSPTYVGP